MTLLEEGILSDPDLDDVEEFYAHCYPWGTPQALCGILPEDDKHWLMHQSYGQKPVPLNRGTTNCPVCLAPLCPECERSLKKIS